ncbi:MAG TPA: hypothetical protein VL991_13825 [Terracidiphilus sp.]|jgi:hypothetical protein|nr:hypothetical protein [Terracidiphilus sp.]
MPNLSTQIGTLYRVIGQCRPAPCVDGRHEAELLLQAGILATECAALQNKWRNVARRFYCLWFSLPLSIWLSSGSIGLLLYWQTLSGAACLVERLLGKPKLAVAGFDSGDGDVR